jgi:hypothetical protein
VSPGATSPSLARLVAAGVLDAELGGLAALLLDLGVPILVAGPRGSGRRALLDALVAALPTGRQPAAVAPNAERRLVRVAGTLSAGRPPGLLRAALAATGSRSGLAAAVEARDLAGVLEVLRGEGLTGDEISFLGAVLVLGSRGTAGSTRRPATRVIAAHYLRPVARDAEGHVQRLGPAVLATWDAAGSQYDHFAWGIYPELAARTGRRAGDLELEHRERSGTLGARSVPGPV